MARRTVNRPRKGAPSIVAIREARAAVYIRVSTSEQALEGVSLEAQIARACAYAEAARLEITAIYRDEGVSGGTALAQRPEGARLLDAIRRGEHAHVIAVKLDRCFRDAVDCMRTVETWTRAGVALHLVDLGGQALETRSAMGRFFLSVMASCAELELGNVRERTRLALAHKRARGDRLGATPLGFCTPTPGAPLVPVPEELAVVRRLLELCANDLPFAHVARALDGEGHRTKRGGRWQCATVRRVWMARDRYQGLLGPESEHLTRAR